MRLLLFAVGLFQLAIINYVSIPDYSLSYEERLWLVCIFVLGCVSALVSYLKGKK